MKKIFKSLFTVCTIFFIVSFMPYKLSPLAVLSLVFYTAVAAIVVWEASE